MLMFHSLHQSRTTSTFCSLVSNRAAPTSTLVLGLIYNIHNKLFLYNHKTSEQYLYSVDLEILPILPVVLRENINSYTEVTLARSHSITTRTGTFVHCIWVRDNLRKWNMCQSNAMGKHIYTLPVAVTHHAS